MYCKAIISSDIGTGSSYVNINGETGLVVPPADSQSFSDAMLKIEHDTKLCEKLGINALIIFDQYLTSPPYAQSYTKLYSELFGNVC